MSADCSPADEHEYEGGVRDAVVFLVGCAALVQALSDGHLRYVKPSFQPFLLAAGVLLVVMALAGFVRGTRPDRAKVGVAAAEGGAGDGPEDIPGAGLPQDAPPGAELHTAPRPDVGHDDLAQAGHGHSHASMPRVAWLLLLPVAVLAFVSPPPLGSWSAARAGNRVVAPEDGYRYPEVKRGPDGVAELTLMDYSQRVLFDEGRSLVDEKVRLSGFVTPAEEPGTFFLTRILLSCCAADGRPVKVAVSTDEPVPPADTWLEVTGTWPGPDEAIVTESQRVAPLAAESLQRIPTPENTYG